MIYTIGECNKNLMQINFFLFEYHCTIRIYRFIPRRNGKVKNETVAHPIHLKMPLSFEYRIDHISILIEHIVPFVIFHDIAIGICSNFFS
jgi:hypothetical protein